MITAVKDIPFLIYKNLCAGSLSGATITLVPALGGAAIEVSEYTMEENHNSYLLSLANELEGSYRLVIGSGTTIYYTENLKYVS